ncbi:hypothetical protein RFI_30444 [Reticulomyxa filosa]|uniref:Uncharacterized protein n=1 Tax=Reticulomyxa filosa TaxID=46433 RepID=X6M0M5_RETFI|nr:hypothetical protein RFI_30444 [Reticulomyxa filosa]|eukprot:ETO06952.1 hypothetical protein RFI_30444 [Reticulomyxa filosa]
MLSTEEELRICQGEALEYKLQIDAEVCQIENLQILLNEEIDKEQGCRDENKIFDKKLDELLQLKEQKIEICKGLRESHRNLKNEFEQLQVLFNNDTCFDFYIIATTATLRSKDLQMVMEKERSCEEMSVRIKEKDEENDRLFTQCTEKTAYVSQLVSQINQTSTFIEQLQTEMETVYTNTSVELINLLSFKHREVEKKIENLREEINNKEITIEQLTNELWQANAVVHVKMSGCNEAMETHKDTNLQHAQGLSEILQMNLEAAHKHLSEYADLLSVVYYFDTFTILQKSSAMKRERIIDQEVETFELEFKVEMEENLEKWGNAHKSNLKQLNNLQEQKKEMEQTFNEAIAEAQTLENNAAAVNDEINKIKDQLENLETKICFTRTKISQSQQIHQQQNEISYQLGMEITAKNGELERTEKQRQQILEKKKLNMELIKSVSFVVFHTYCFFLYVWKCINVEIEKNSDAEKVEIRENDMKNEAVEPKEEYTKSEASPAVTPKKKIKKKRINESDNDSDYIPEKVKRTKRKKNSVSSRQNSHNQSKKVRKVSNGIKTIRNDATSLATQPTKKLSLASQGDIKEDKEELMFAQTPSLPKRVSFSVFESVKDAQFITYTR